MALTNEASLGVLEDQSCVAHSGALDIQIGHRKCWEFCRYTF